MDKAEPGHEVCHGQIWRVAWHGGDDIEEFTKIIIAHELAHEVWNNIADDQFKEAVLDEARE